MISVICKKHLSPKSAKAAKSLAKRASFKPALRTRAINRFRVQLSTLMANVAVSLHQHLVHALSLLM